MTTWLEASYIAAERSCGSAPPQVLKLLSPRVRLWRAATCSEVIVTHARQHRHAWGAAHTRPPMNDLISAPDQIRFLHRLSTWRGNIPTFGILVIWRRRRALNWSGRGNHGTWGGIYPIADPNQRADLISASLCASGCDVCLSWVTDFTSPTWNSSLRIRAASTRRASIRRCRHGTIQHLMWWVRLSGTRWPKDRWKVFERAKNIEKKICICIWSQF